MIEIIVNEVDAVGNRRLIGEAHIHKAPSSTTETGDYDAYFSQLRKPLLQFRPWRHIRLENYHRWRYSSHWHLIGFVFMTLVELVNGDGAPRPTGKRK